jgi:hypothetical protein
MHPKLLEVLDVTLELAGLGPQTQQVLLSLLDALQ